MKSSSMQTENTGRKCFPVSTWIAMLFLAGTPTIASTFSPPVSTMTLTQSYAAFDETGNGEYHTGFDLVSSTGSKTIYAVAAGTARVLPQSSYPNQNHGLGNVIILDHGQGQGPFTLYGHLESFAIANGATVSAGQVIATMGNTGCASLGCGVHLHFEVKRWGVLGNLDDDLGPEWGYTPDIPNLYGYQNPWPYFDYDLQGLDHSVVTADSNQIVRTGPDASQYTLTVDSVAQGQLFVAFRRVGGWYEVDLASDEGPATGWILATSQSATSRAEVDDPTRGTIGVNVRSSSTINASVLSHVWDDQWFAAIDTAPAGSGCSSDWVKIPLPGSAGSSAGWVCSDFLAVHGTPSCHDLILSHSGQGTDPSPSPAESPGCAPGSFVAGEMVSLTATPAAGWMVDSWTGTNNDGTTSSSNTVTMPDGSHTATVVYVEEGGPGGCTDDSYEGVGSDNSDDSCFGASIGVGERQSHSHCDEDWVYFQGSAGSTYEIRTLNLGGGADTVVELYQNCSTFLTSNDDYEGLASRVVWTPSSDEYLDVRIAEFGGNYAAGEVYDVQVTCLENCGGCSDLTVSDATISTAETYTACGDVTLGPNLVLTSTADVIVEAGGSVVLTNGTSIAAGARLAVSSGSN